MYIYKLYIFIYTSQPPTECFYTKITVDWNSLKLIIKKFCYEISKILHTDVNFTCKIKKHSSSWGMLGISKEIQKSKAKEKIEDSKNKLKERKVIQSAYV